MPENANIHLLVGEDDYLVETAARKILEAAVEPSLRSTAVEIVPGKAGNKEAQLASISSCIASIQSPPFLDPVKLTWWRGVDFLPVGGGKGPSADVKDALEKFANDLAAHPLPSNQFLIITADKLLSTSIFAKTFKKFADVVISATSQKSKDRVESAMMRLPDLAQAEKLQFDPGVDDAFIAKVGVDTRTIVSELAKLRTYLGSERDNVSAADVALICSPGGEEPELWDITDALAQRNASAFLKAVSNHNVDVKFVMTLVAMCEKFFREAIFLADALAQGWLLPYGGWAKNVPPEAVEDLRLLGLDPSAQLPYVFRKKLSAIRKNGNDRSGYTLRELRVARYLLLQAREKIVSGGADGGFVVQQLLRIIGTARR